MGKHLYLAALKPGISVYDVRQPTKPRGVGFVPLTDSPYNVLGVKDNGLSDADPLVNGVDIDCSPFHADTRGSYAVVPTTDFAAWVSGRKQ